MVTLHFAVQSGQVGAGAWTSAVWRLKSERDVTTSTCPAVARTAVTRTNSVTTPPGTAGVSAATENPSPAHPLTDDNTTAPPTSPVK